MDLECVMPDDVSLPFLNTLNETRVNINSDETNIKADFYCRVNSLITGTPKEKKNLFLHRRETNLFPEENGQEG